jgi:hypothetical protein
LGVSRFDLFVAEELIYGRPPQVSVGEQGFGAIWQDVADSFDKPAMITEYGCSAYHPEWDRKKAEEAQARYLMGNWSDIENNAAGHGAGVALGGILFEWSDEW